MGEPIIPASTLHSTWFLNLRANVLLVALAACGAEKAHRHPSKPMPPTVATLIHDLALTPHPEGGHYRELYRSTVPVALADDRGSRTALTAIYFLLAEGEYSRLHRVRSDEVWHHVEGAPMQLTLISPSLDTLRVVTIGPRAGDVAPFEVIPAGWWQAARPDGGHSLCSCFVAPGFDFRDFSFMDEAGAQAQVRTRFPDVAPLL
jgi:uncharacterized protein